MATVYNSVGFECILFDKNKCPYSGPEREVKCFEDSVKCYKDKYGSFRFVMYLNGVAVSGLQIMVEEGRTAIATNVFTVKEHRRKGYSKIVFQEALKHFTTIGFSNNRSADGKAYVLFCEHIISLSVK